MICKIAIISEKHTLNSLEYADRGGELLSSNFVAGTPKEIYKDFEYVQSFNDRAKNKSIHAIISLNPKDDLSKLTRQDYIDICNQYLKKHGFHNNQSAIYLHSDKQHTHFHIIANRIRLNDGKSVSSSHNYAKNVEFSKEIELRYNLIKTNRKTKGVDFVKDNTRANKIKLKVDVAILKSSSINAFIYEMKKQNVLVLKGRGIAFIDTSGAKFKGSDLGREYSLQNIEKRINSGIEINYQTEQATEIIIEKPITENNHFISDDNIPRHFFNKAAAQDDEREDGRKSWKSKKGLSR